MKPQSSQDKYSSSAKEFLQGIKGAKSALIEDGGHVPQIDNPQAFLREINRFLSSS